MAIIIEQEKRRVNWFMLALGIAIVGIAAATIYFLFFAAVPFIEKVAPSGNLETIKKFSSIDLNPDAIRADKVFVTLKMYPAENPKTAEKRSNPFLPR